MIENIPDLDAAADGLGGDDGLGPRLALASDWVPGDPCPKSGLACDRLSCFESGECPLRATLTSELAAEAGRYLARWAKEAGAEGMCAGCAFREGTRANRTDDTIVSIVECLRTGATEFMCHEGIAPGEAPREVCRGWAALTCGSDVDPGSRISEGDDGK